jgi:hypothetical protein
MKKPRDGVAFSQVEWLIVVKPLRLTSNPRCAGIPGFSYVHNGVFAIFLADYPLCETGVWDSGSLQ